REWRIANSEWNIFFPIRHSPFATRLIQSPLHFLDAEAFDDITGAHVLIAFEGHAAFLARLDLAHLILEALEGRERALMDDHVVADQPHPGAALDDAFGDPAARHLADLG